MKAQWLQTQSEKCLLLSFYTYQNEGNVVLYTSMVVKSFIECFEMC